MKSREGPRFTRIPSRSMALFSILFLMSIAMCNQVKAETNTVETLHAILDSIKTIQEDFRGNMCTWFDEEQGETFLLMNKLKWRLTNSVRDTEHKLGVANEIKKNAPLSKEAGAALLSADLALAITGMGPYALPLFVAEGFVLAIDIGPWLGTTILEYWLTETYEVTVEGEKETLTAKDILRLLEELVPKLEKSLCCQCGPNGPPNARQFCDNTYAPRETWEQLNDRARRQWWGKWWRENCTSAGTTEPVH